MPDIKSRLHYGDLLYQKDKKDQKVDPLNLEDHISHSQYCNKDNMLCKEIETELMILFSGAMEDERFQGIAVSSVEPASGITSVLVKVYPLYEEDMLDPETILDWLNSAKKYLRSEIARAINRRKVPDLFFSVVSGSEEVY